MNLKKKSVMYCVLCINSKNMVEMYDKAKTGISDSREGFKDIRNLCLRFSNKAGLH